MTKPVYGNGEFTKATCGHCGSEYWVTSGAWLRKGREAAGVTLREFARRVGVSAAYISDIERDNRRCSSRIEGEYRKLRDGSWRVK